MAETLPLEMFIYEIPSERRDSRHRLLDTLMYLHGGDVIVTAKNKRHLITSCNGAEIGPDGTCNLGYDFYLVTHVGKVQQKPNGTAC